MSLDKDAIRVDVTRKYCLHPGDVISKNDGGRHFIGVSRLADLYGVDVRECQVYNKGAPVHIVPVGVECLYPSYSGNYRRRPDAGQGGGSDGR